MFHVQLDEPPAYARAMTFAQSLYLGAFAPNEQPPKLGEHGIALRELPSASRQRSVLRGLCDRKKLGEPKAPSAT
jgi:hypothetical protein